MTDHLATGMKRMIRTVARSASLSDRLGERSRLLRLTGSVLSLVLINLLGASFGLTVGINLVTVLTAAVLGLPGVTALAVSRLILNL